MRTLLLSVLLAVSVQAIAASPEQPYVKKIDGPGPDANSAVTVQVRVPKHPTPWSVIRNRSGKPVATTDAVAEATPAVAAVANPQGLPMIAASDPKNNASTAAAGTPATTATANSPVVGQPVVVYATMAQAAKAGVDPLGERKAAVVVSQVQPSSSKFDIRHPAAWLPWLKDNSALATRYALVMLGVLLAAFFSFKLLNRRASQD